MHAIRHAFTSSVLAVAVTLVHGAAARAESIPLPTVDYESKAAMFGGGTMSSRHSKGRMRVEVQAPGMPQPMTSIIDLRARKMFMTITMPGAPAMTAEVDFSDEQQYGVVAGKGRRIGSATIAGEACDLWEVEGTGKETVGQAATACLTHDSITLRVEITIDGKRETVFEVTELKRAPQDPKLFALPAAAQIMQQRQGLIPRK